MTQPLAGAKSVGTENELDIRGLFRVLWQGKLWIVGIALGFAVSACLHLLCKTRVERHGDHRPTNGEYAWRLLLPAAIPA